MKVYPLTPALAARLERYKRYVELAWQETSNAIVIGNGTPDDVVIAILCKRLNGHATVAITISEKYKNIAALETTNNLVYGGTRIEKCVIVIDQEDNSIDDIITKGERKLSNLGIKFRKVIDKGRVVVYECKKAQKVAKLCLCINGLNNDFARHSIEDHLLEVAKTIGLITNYNNYNNAKEVWNMLTKDRQISVIEQVLNLDKVEAIFSQQIDALKITFLDTTFNFP